MIGLKMIDVKERDSRIIGAIIIPLLVEGTCTYEISSEKNYRLLMVKDTRAGWLSVSYELDRYSFDSRNNLSRALPPHIFLSNGLESQSWIQMLMGNFIDQKLSSNCLYLAELSALPLDVNGMYFQFIPHSIEFTAVKNLNYSAPTIENFESVIPYSLGILVVSCSGGHSTVAKIIEVQVVKNNYRYTCRTISGDAVYYYHNEIVLARESFDVEAKNREHYVSNIECGRLFDVGEIFMVDQTRDLKNKYIYNKSGTVTLQLSKYERFFKQVIPQIKNEK